MNIYGPDHSCGDLSRKPIIAVWAEERGSLRTGRYEWSFGNGAFGNSHAHCGYTMMSSGRILRMGLAAVDARNDGNLLGSVTVNIVVNGNENISYGVTKPSDQFSGTVTFSIPLELAPLDRINFRSRTTNKTASAVVSLLIELDM